MIEYLTMTDNTHAPAVVKMMNALYAEDTVEAAPAPPDPAGTVRAFLARPERGRIIVFAEGGTVHGYALLVPFWSNEYGGVVVFVDELYVTPDARGRGVGRGLFAFIARERPFAAVAVFLEVSPENVPARGLYESIGFRQRRNATLSHRLPADPA